MFSLLNIADHVEAHGEPLWAYRRCHVELRLRKFSILSSVSGTSHCICRLADRRVQVLDNRAVAHVGLRLRGEDREATLMQI